jgi:thiol-disulfide isomerase/thioredoxin
MKLMCRRGTIVSLILLVSFPRYSCSQETISATTIGVDDDDISDLDDIVGGDSNELLMMDNNNNLDAEFVAAAECDITSNIIDEFATPMAEVNSSVVNDDKDDVNTPIAKITEEDNEVSSVEEGATTTTKSEGDETSKETPDTDTASAVIQQVGPFVDLLGDLLLSLEMIDKTKAQVHQHHTNVALQGKKVVGLYFSADWCGPCRQFTPELVNFYNKINSRRGKKNEFEIVWISRCRSIDAFGQYFTQMGGWLALPPNEATGARGQYLGEKFGVKGIPTLVLLDEIGNLITTDARNKIPYDKAGIGFPWKSPISVLISTLLPRSFRMMVKGRGAKVLGLMRRVITGKGTKIREALARRSQLGRRAAANAKR